MLKYMSRTNSPVSAVDVGKKLKIDHRLAKKVLLELKKEKKIKAKRLAEGIWIFWQD